MKKTQKKSSAWRHLYMRYRFWLICINYNFDFLVLYKMYFQNYFARRSIILESFTSHLQHSRPCCIRYTNSRLRLEFVYLIQHGRSCCKYYLWKFGRTQNNIRGKTRPTGSFSHWLFLVLPNFHACFYNCIETRKMFSIS